MLSQSLYRTFVLWHIGNPGFFGAHGRSRRAVCLPSVALLFMFTHDISGVAVAVKSKFTLISHEVNSQCLLWEKWIFKRELEEQEEPHGNKDLLHLWGQGKEPLKINAASAVPSVLKG